MNPEDLHEAIEQGNVVLIKKWIQEERNFNTRLDGQTPLNHAIQKENLDICKCLIAAQADIDAINENHAAIAPGQTALHLATQKGLLEIVIALVNARADKNKRDQNHYTAIDYAVMHGHSRIVAYLLDQNCDISSQRGENSESILHLSLKKLCKDPIGPLGFFHPQENYPAQRKVIEWLIQKSASVLTIVNINDRSPLAEAIFLLKESETSKHYTEHFYDVIRLFIYYQAQVMNMNPFVTNSKVISERILIDQCAITSNDSKERIQRQLQQWIKYKKITGQFEALLKDQKNSSIETEYVFKFLIEILYSFKAEVLWMITVISLNLSMRHNEGMQTWPNELIDKILFYVIENLRQDPTVYRSKAFAFWDTHDTSRNIEWTNDSRLRSVAVSLWREILITRSKYIVSKTDKSTHLHSSTPSLISK